MAGMALDGPGGVDHPPHGLIRVVLGPQVRLPFQGGVDGDVQLAGNQVGQTLAFCGRKPLHPRDVLDRRPSLEAAERDDLRDVAILLADVVDHGRAAVLADVDVDIRVFASIRVGKPLKEQAVSNRAGIGKAQRITHHRSHARAPRRSGDIPLARPVDEVPNDEEVRTDELVRKDHQLRLETLPDGVGDPLGPVAP